MVSEPSPPTVISASMPASVEALDQFVGAVDLDVGAVGLEHRIAGRIPAVRRAQDRAARVLDAPNRLTVEDHQSRRSDTPRGASTR